MEQKSTKLGVIMGSNKFNLDTLDTFMNQRVNTEFGTSFVWVGEKCVVLPRHGENRNIPPHKINHRANMQTFKSLGVDKVISFTSVGSLSLDLKPTAMLMPDDYINLDTIHTYFDDEIKHIIPGLDMPLRDEVYANIKEILTNIKFNGIYIQTRGPRFETKAEIQMLKNFGDVTGMTMAAEATLAKELQIRYANISIVDNFCNGLGIEPLTTQNLMANQAKKAENIEIIIKRSIEKPN